MKTILNNFFCKHFKKIIKYLQISRLKIKNAKKLREFTLY